ncbi:FAGL346Wp [Eremothecium gossypii FDAG1]|nr:FAGL346Wp [Eremothecium gossypii FDAG1]
MTAALADEYNEDAKRGTSSIRRSTASFSESGSDFLNSGDREKLGDSTLQPQRRLFSWVHGKDLPPVPDEEERERYPLYRANPLSRMMFWWVVPVIRVGYRRTLQPNDLWVVDGSLGVDEMYKRFVRHFRRYVQRAEAQYRLEHPEATQEEIRTNARMRNNDLLRALCITFRWPLFLALLNAAVTNLLSCAQPLVTRAIIRHLDPHSRESVGVGVAYAICACVLLFINGYSFNHMTHQSMRTALQIRTVLTKAILGKALVLSGKARNEWPPGTLISMASTDLSRMEFAVFFQPFLLVFPLVLALGVALLLVTVGPVGLLGLAVFIVALGLATLAFRKMVKYRVAATVFTDARVTLMREIMNSMKMLKYYCWERAYEERVTDVRYKEVHKVRQVMIFRSILVTTAVTLSTIAGMVCFLAMSHLNSENRNAANVFSALSLFQALSIQLFFIPTALSTGADAKIALKRIQKLLWASEQSHRQDDSSDKLGPLDPSVAIQVESASFEWEGQKDSDLKGAQKTEDDSVQSDTVTVLSKKREEKQSREEVFKVPFTGLNDLSFSIKKGEFIIVIGAIGTGKTSLLNAVAGYMKKTTGSVHVNGSLLFCGVPWIQNATIRDNIIFGSSFDQTRYDEVVNACALEADFKIFPAGDKTEVGERGITLSGGQKARISLARAIYKDRDIYLFDDIISAVDANVAAHITQKCLLDRLQNRTRILATHQLALVQEASRVIFLGQDGSFDMGTPAELHEKNSQFRNLMSLSSQTNAEESEMESIRSQSKSKKASTAPVSMPDFNEEIDDGRITSKEERAVNALKFKVYKDYLMAGEKSSKMLIVTVLITLVLMTTFFSLFNSVWLSFWTEYRFPGRQDAFYMGIYFMLTCLTFIFTNLEFTFLLHIGLSASRRLNLSAAKRILYAPMSFIDTTPMGRILNRFTKDTDVLDNELTDSTRMFVFQMANVVGVFILSIAYLPYVAIAVPISVLLLLFIGDHYQSAGREVKRLEAIQRSFVYNNLGEVLDGLDTIRAYNAQSRFLRKSDYFLNRTNEAGYLVIGARCWVALTTDLVAIAIALIVTLLCVTRVIHITPSSAGVLLTVVLQMPAYFNMVLRGFTELENNMNSTQRVHYYATALPQEAPQYLPGAAPPAGWPAAGEIVFQEVSFAYRPGLPLALCGVSFHVRAGEKIGICGRTGAGKTSVTTALYRLSELESGSIKIDGVDIATLGLHDLRSALSIIPQDPLLFRGTVRKNLDPFAEHTDGTLWSALVRSGVVPAGVVPTSHKFHLDQEVDEGGANFSLGERQLLALARALVRSTRILILDEATSSVDYATDARVQARIAAEFRQATVLCVAHRLRTIISYDRILVLDQGRVAEFDTPYRLFAREDSLFRAMCVHTGISASDFAPAADIPSL